LPLQSSSTPLHVSGLGFCTGWQLTFPCEHDVTPKAQTPGWPVGQD
jgi:hypothetical protein